MKEVVNYFSIGGKDYKLTFMKGNYQGSHTVMSLHIHLLGEDLPCIICYRSIVKDSYRLHCNINRKGLKPLTMKEFKIEAIKYLTNS